jgi:hypothetical protein
MRKEITAPASSEPATAAPGPSRSLKIDLLVIAMFYVGATALVSPTSTLNIRLWRFDSTQIVAVLVGLIGWRRLVASKEMLSYLRWGGLLAAWAFIAWVAEWDFRDSSYHARTFVLILVIIIPGLAALLREVRYRRAIVAGLLAEAAVYAWVGVFRLIGGRSMFDVPGRPRTIVVLDMGRNAINVLILLAIPMLLWKKGPARLIVKLPLLIVYFVFVAWSGGRGGLLGLIFIAVVYVMIQPGRSRLLRAMYAIVLVAVVAYIGLDAVGGQATESSNRLIATLRGEKTTSTESRELLVRKAWHLALKNPAFGVGMGDFVDTYDPVVEEATSKRVRDYVTLQSDEHNTYAEMMAEIGFPGVFLFVAMLFAVFRIGWRYRRSPEVRLWTTSYAGLMLQLLVVGDIALGGLFYLPIALLLGMTSDPDVWAEGAHHRTPVLR